MSFFAYDDGTLTCERFSLSRLAQELGTPLYVYSRQAIIENCRAVERAFAGTPHLTTYAVKANSNLRILKLIAEQRLGADVGSVGEMFLALKAGFHPSNISFSGVGKRDDEIGFAMHKEILAFNVESEEEIEVINAIAGRWGKIAPILLRLNLDIDAGTHAYISTSMKQNKFGVASTRAAAVLKHAQELPNIFVRGIHSHLGSQIISVETFVEAARALKNLVDELRAQEIEIHDLDFGGGYGIQYHGFINDPQIPFEKPEGKNISIAAFIEAVLPILTQTGCNISIQPGRAIVANAGALLTKVLYRKETDKRTFIIVDGGMNDLLRPSLYQAHHQIVPVRLNKAVFERVDVVGPCCESGDFFAQDRVLPRAERNDLLSVMCAGAYGMVLSSNYNARLRPAEVLIDGDSYEVIREREELQSLLH